MKKVVAIITARGGSKGLPGKNIRSFAGKPLIAWSILAAKKALLIEDIIVSTDDLHISEIATQYGARVPRLRNYKFAQDDSPHIDSVLEALSWVGKEYTHCCLLQPTSPLRYPADIDNACSIALTKNVNSVVSVTETIKHPFIVKNKILNRLLCPAALVGYLPRQKIQPGYFVNGAIYVNKIKHLKRARSFYDTLMAYYTMPEERSFQIDSLFDFELAEYIMLKDLDYRYVTRSTFNGRNYQTDIRI